MRQFVRLAGLVVVLGIAACSSSDSGGGNTGGAGGNAGSTSAGGAAGMGGSSGAGGVSAAGGASGSGGNGGVGGTGANSGDAGSVACGPTLMGQGCADAGATCAYPSHQCRCTQGLWICSLCPDTAPPTGASCASMISVCTYTGANQCTCGGVPLPVWSCTKS
jgi:hypothetical protein